MTICIGPFKTNPYNFNMNLKLRTFYTANLFKKTQGKYFPYYQRVI